MGEGHHNHQHQFLLRHHTTPSQTRTNSRLSSLKGGEIVEVQGGHIVRATGRKDRHSKVCTAKGPRDRRVRLSAHTAIQFYDVQDRLGYDRPSKAVDWLIKNAKAAIDELAELPPWRPTATTPTVASDPEAEGQELGIGDSGKKALGVVDEPSVAAPSGSSAYGFSNSSFLPPSMDSDSIADTIKSFFPMTASSSPSVGFHNYSAEAANQAQDLRLSLQSFQDHQILHNHHHHHHNHNESNTSASEQAFFSSSAPLVYNSTSANWSEQQPRLVPWTSSAETGGGYVFNLPLPQQHGVPLFGQSPFLSQRGPLQSSNNSPSILAWMEPVGVAAENQEAAAHAFASSGGFSGFHIPARIQGEEEHDKLPSVSRR